MEKWILNIVSLLVVAAIIYFLGREFVKNWHVIENFRFNFNAPLLILASLAYAGSLLMMAIGWHVILVYLHAPLPFIKTIIYFFITQPAKYIPGKIWLAVARMRFCKKYNISNSVTLLSTGTEAVLEIFAGTYVSIMAFLTSTVLIKHIPLWVPLAVTALGILLLIPRIFYAIINLYLKIVRQNPIPKEKQVSFGKLFLLQLIYTGALIGIGLSQFLFLQSFAPVSFTHFSLLLSIGAFSYAASIIALFSPSGLGVREGIWYLALKKITPKHIALIYSLASRLWMIIIEALLAFGSLPLLLLVSKKGKGDGIEG